MGSVDMTALELTSGESDDERGIWGLGFRVFVGFVYGAIILAGLFGNSLVVAAIARQRRFHTRGNYLIGSLAAADLLVCLLVAPYSALMTLHEFGPQSGRAWWIPSNITCQIFLFFDVACCTASILHLCAIAYDRYSVITKLRFQIKTTFVRVLPYIFCIWFAASLLSVTPHIFFPQITKNDVSLSDHVITTTASALHNETESAVISALKSNMFTTRHGLLCVVNTNKIYRVVATTVAFYAPLSFIIAIYWRVFHIAWQRVHMFKSPLQKGVLSVAQQLGHSLSHMSVSENPVESHLSERKVSASSNDEESNDGVSNGQVLRRKFSALLSCIRTEKEETGVPYGSCTQNIQPTGMTPVGKVASCCEAGKNSPNLNNNATLVTELSNESKQATCNTPIGSLPGKSTSCPTNQERRETEPDNTSKLLKPGTIRRPRSDSIHSLKKLRTVSHSSALGRTASTSSVQRQRARLRLRRERKIIKTIGMVIGAFIICWLPFFLKELIFPFCSTCSLPPPAEVFINWLGYANSALNPFIYAYSNDEFNKAFKRLFRDFHRWIGSIT